MKIAVVTANIGNIDAVVGLPPQSVDFDFFYYTEHNLPFPLPNLSNRMKARYIKCQAHKFLAVLNYDFIIWLDSRVRVTAKEFIEIIIKDIGNNPIALFNHPDRSTVLDEMNYIVNMINKGNHYLLSRYGNQQMDKELQFYEDAGIDPPLYMSTVMVWRPNEFMRRLFDLWWERNIQYSHFDQAMLCFLLQNGRVDVSALEMNDYKKLIVLEKHVL